MTQPSRRSPHCQANDVECWPTTKARLDRAIGDRVSVGNECIRYLQSASCERRHFCRRFAIHMPRLAVWRPGNPGGLPGSFDPCFKIRDSYGIRSRRYDRSFLRSFRGQYFHVRVLFTFSRAFYLALPWRRLLERRNTRQVPIARLYRHQHRAISLGGVDLRACRRRDHRRRFRRIRSLLSTLTLARAARQIRSASA